MSRRKVAEDERKKGNCVYFYERTSRLRRLGLKDARALKRLLERLLDDYEAQELDQTSQKG